jgi:hypothetical protein
MTSLNTSTNRYLEKNVVDGVDKIKFQDDGHLYWAYSKYYQGWVATKDGMGGLPIVSCSGVLNLYFHYDRYAIALRIWNKPKNRHAMEYDVTNRYFGCQSVEDVMNKWNAGRIAGTKLHAIYEDLANIVEYDRDHPVDEVVMSMQHIYVNKNLEGYDEKAYFYDFVKEFHIDDKSSGVSFYRTELCLWNDVLHITGTIDGLLYNAKDDSYIIIDWKRCKDGVKGDPKKGKPVHMLSPGGRGMGLDIFEGIRNNSMNRYGCQLTLYKKLFEHMTGKRVSGMFIVAIDSKLVGKASALKIHTVPLNKFDEHIRQAFEVRAREMLSQCEATLDDDHMDKLIELIDEGDNIREAHESQMVEGGDV